MKKILVTGGSGLIGTALKEISSSYPYEFIFANSKNADLTNSYDARGLFKWYKPDYVIHLAANVGGLFKNMNYKVDMLEKNLMINYNVVKNCYNFEVEKSINCLSTCIFPNNVAYPINEEMLHNGPPHNSNDAYAYAKRMLEVQCNAYNNEKGTNYICVIPTNIYGEHDNFSLEDGHVIPALIHRCYNAKKKDEDFIVKGSGKPLRQFIYSKDLAKLFMWTLENYNKKTPLILSVRENDEISIENVARLIAREFNYEHRIKFDTSFSDGQFKKTADNTKLMNLIGDFQFTPIEEGIKNSVKWFNENYNGARK